MFSIPDLNKVVFEQDNGGNQMAVIPYMLMEHGRQQLDLIEDMRENIVTGMRQPLRLFGSEIEASVGDKGGRQEVQGGGEGTLVLSLFQVREGLRVYVRSVVASRTIICREDTCGFCDKEAETIEYALLMCPRSATVWFGSPLGLCSFHRSEEGYGGWKEYMAHNVSKESFELLLVLVWSIWKVHNDFIWNGVDVSPLDTQIKVQTWLAKFKKWNDVAPQQSSARIYKWQSPASRWIKCNFDAAWDEKGSTGGCGMVVRNSEGGFLAAQVSREEGVRSVLHAEAVAARAVAMFLCRWVTEQVQVEGYALLVIYAIQNEGVAYSGHYGHMFDDTRRLLQDFKQ
ncbi:hypothetical protein ACFX15_012902 [Malus domestica]